MSEKCPKCGEELYYDEQSQHKGKRGLRIPRNVKNNKTHFKTCKK